MTPQPISARATEMPRRIEMTLAASARAIQSEATKYGLVVSTIV